MHKMENLPEQVFEVEKRLPQEILKKVFEALPPKGRKAGVMVNRRWRSVGEAPDLWAWVQLPYVLDQDSRARVIAMLRCERLARVEEIYIDPPPVSEDLLQAMINHEGLKRIDLHGEGGELPAGLNPQLVMNVLTGVELLKLPLFAPLLPTHLIIALLTEVSQGGSNLTVLHLGGTDLDGVPAALVASALRSLVEVKLGGITSDQMAALCEAIDQGSSIEKLSLFDSLPEKDERTGGPLNLKPLVNLKEVKLWNNFFTRQELIDFFAALSDSTKLRVLNINDLPWPAESEEVLDGSTELIAIAINFLERVKMMAYAYQVCRLQS